MKPEVFEVEKAPESRIEIVRKPCEETVSVQNVKLSGQLAKVAQLLEVGMSNVEIAKELKLAKRTVKHYITDISRKLEVKVGGGMRIKIANMRRASDEMEFVAPATLNLTDRELQILNLVARGLTNREIALLLGYTSRTAEQLMKNYCRGIFQKTRLTTRAQVATWYWQHCQSSPIRPFPEPAGEVLKGAVNHV